MKEPSASVKGRFEFMVICCGIFFACAYARIFWSICADIKTNATEVTTVKARTVGSDSTMMLSFDAYDSFKSNLPSTGRWWLSRTDSSGNEEVVGSDEIVFRPHWRPKTIRYNLTLAVSDFQDESSTYSLSVRDAWGFENRTLSLTC